MAILSRILIQPQRRFDLEDLSALQSAQRTDSKLKTLRMYSDKNQVVSGFVVTGIGLKEATVQLDGSTLVIPQNTSDFSWFTAEPGAPDETITDAQLVDDSRNYVEIELCTEDNTPLTKAFWDPEAQGGEGLEFNQIVDTIKDLKVNLVVSTGGFSGSADRLPLAIIDVDASGNINLIKDERELFGRLALPGDLDNEFAWGTKQEPVYQLTLTGAVGTFLAGEELTIGGETATVVTGGTSSITFNRPTGINYESGDSVSGADSGASGTVNTVYETFTGVDKSLDTQESINKAIFTEFKRLKNTSSWWSDTNKSVNGLSDSEHSIIVQAVADAKWSWDGSDLSITDDSGSPLDSDVLAYLRIFSRGSDLELTRQDGQDSSDTIAIAEDEVMFVKLPSSGDRTYSGAGTTDTEFQVASRSDYEQSDENYWIAYRWLNRLYIRGYGELEAGEEVSISDPEKEDLLNQISNNQEKNNQDRGLKLIEGGTWSLADDGETLSWDADAFVQVPGLNQTRNTIAAASFTLPNANSVLYVNLERDSGPATVLTPVVADEDAISPLTDVIFIIARRVDNGVVVGESTLLGAGEELELDGHLQEINRYFDPLKLDQHESDNDKVRINGTESSLLDDTELGKILNTFELSFGGAVIDFTTGDVFESDGTTPLGNNFTPFTIPAGEYFWYGISITPGTVNSLNEQNGLIQVDAASAANSSASAAPKANITGQIKLGLVQVQNNAGNIEVTEVRRLDVGSGSGGSGTGLFKVRTMDPVATTLPTGASYTTDGVSLVNGDLVLFTNLGTNNNRVYEISGVGSSISWDPVRAFDNDFDPAEGDLVVVGEGDAFAVQIARFDGSEFLVNDTVRYFDGVSANFWEQSSIKSLNITNNTTGNVFSVSVTGSENFIVDYSILRGTSKETGSIVITSNGTDAALSRTNSYLGDVGIEFDAQINAGNLELSYTSENLSSDATMKYFTRRWSNSFGGPTGIPNYSTSGPSSTVTAAGSPGEIQYHGSSGNLDADSRLQWDASAGVLEKDGMIDSVLRSGFTLADNQTTPTSIFNFPTSSYKHSIVEYSVERDGEYRTGRILIANTGTGANLSDDFVETGSTGVTFSVGVSSGNVELRYITTSTGVSANFQYTIRQWG